MSLKAPPVGPYGLNEELSIALTRARMLEGGPAYAFAAEAGIHPSELSRWVNGHKVPTRLMIAAGVNAKALSTYIGHANISITLDLYRHLMPGSEDEAAGMLDAYFECAWGQELARFGA